MNIHNLVETYLQEFSIPQRYTGLKGEKKLLESIKKTLKMSGKFDSLTITPVGSRANLIATKGQPSLMFFCHLDTVGETPGQKYGYLNGNFNGLGMYDMRGGIACVLSAVNSLKAFDNLGLVFYTGEESDQAGIQEIMQKWSHKPNLIICPESKFKISNGWRGLMVFRVKITGVSAHTSKSDRGKNAVDYMYKYEKFLANQLHQYQKRLFGVSKICMLSIKSWPEDNIEGVLPEIALANFEIRVASEDLTFGVISKMTKSWSVGNGVEVIIERINEYPLVYVPRKRIFGVKEAFEKSGENAKYYSNFKSSGFNDVALLYKKYGIPVISFGPYGGGGHTDSEWVSLNSAVETAIILKSFIEIYGK